MRLAHAIAVTAIVFALGSYAFAQDKTVGGFQGIPWGATEKEIAAKSLGELKYSKCDAFMEKVAARLDTVCDNPTITPYEVAGIPFDLEFTLAEVKKVERRGTFLRC